MRCFNAKVTLYMPRITHKLRGNQAEAPTATHGTDAPLLRHACDQASCACVSLLFSSTLGITWLPCQLGLASQQVSFCVPSPG